MSSWLGRSLVTPEACFLSRNLLYLLRISEVVQLADLHTEPWHEAQLTSKVVYSFDFLHIFLQTRPVILGCCNLYHSHVHVINQ